MVGKAQNATFPGMNPPAPESEDRTVTDGRTVTADENDFFGGGEQVTQESQNQRDEQVQGDNIPGRGRGRGGRRAGAGRPAAPARGRGRGGRNGGRGAGAPVGANRIHELSITVSRGRHDIDEETERTFCGVHGPGSRSRRNGSTGEGPPARGSGVAAPTTPGRGVGTSNAMPANPGA